MNIFIIIFIIILIVIFILTGYYLYTTYKGPQFSDINDSCLYRRFGCCGDMLTPKLDQEGTNCRGF